MSSTRKRSTRNAGNAGIVSAAKFAKKAKKAPEAAVCWNKQDSAPQLSISKDGLTVGGEKGYRMARANAGVREGDFYFEVEILPPVQGSEGGGQGIRVGWAAITGELQAPVG